MSLLKNMLLLIIAMSTLSSFGQISNIEMPTSINQDGNDPAPSAMLDIQSADRGVLIPRLDTGNVAIPIAGLLVYQPSDNTFYYFNGATWSALLNNVAFNNSEIFDADGDTRIMTEESPNEDRIRMDVAGSEVLRIEKNLGEYSQFQIPNSHTSVLIGEDAGNNLATGTNNTIIGDDAGQNLISGARDVILGADAGRDATAGNNAVVIGNSAAMNADDIGDNIIIGANAAQSATQTGLSIIIGLRASQSSANSVDNIVVGREAGRNQDGAISNLILGSFANRDGDGGEENVILGHSAGYQNTGDQNVLIGDEAGYTNQGDENIYLGYQAGQHNEDGNNNIAIGTEAGSENNHGINNIYLGRIAGRHDTSSNNIIIGNAAAIGATFGDGNIIMGDHAALDGAKGSGNVVIGEEVASSSRVESGNVLIGASAARYLDTLSNNVVIGRGAAGGLAGSGGTMEDNVIIGRNAAGLARAKANFNTIVGSHAAYQIREAYRNTILGQHAAREIELGNNNVAIGSEALIANTDGHENVAIGSRALANISEIANNNYEQSRNTVVGFEAGRRLTGNGNIALGYQAAINSHNSDDNIYIGNNSGGPFLGGFSIPGDENIFIGHNTEFLDSPSNSVAIGNRVTLVDSNTIILGDNTNKFIRTGIGTSQPSAKLHVKEGQATNGSIALFTNNNDINVLHVTENNTVQINDTANVKEVLNVGTYFEIGNNVSGGLVKIKTDTSSIGFNDPAFIVEDELNNNLVTISDAGNLGINKAVPLAKIHIKSKAPAEDDFLPILVSDSDDQSLMILNDVGHLTVAAQVFCQDPINPNHAVTLGYMQNNLPIHPHDLSAEAPDTMNLAVCATYCRDLVEGGYDDWGIPSFEEAAYFFGATSDASHVWTSTPFSGTTKYAYDETGTPHFISQTRFFASNIRVRLYNGESEIAGASGDFTRCRCVR